MPGWSPARSPATPTAPSGRSSRSPRKEFAEHGYAGARVDEIADRTRTTKRMIYYYFGSKERLFVAVLERAYAGIRAAEQTIEVDHLDPVAAIRRLAELTFDHHESHPDFIRLVSIENIHRAEHIAGPRGLRGREQPGDRADRARSSSAAAPTAASRATSTPSTST